ncbi:hypothetical protein IC614_03565 [Allosphingosinicella flava]|uniref:SCP domain-containing protein n=1 Tax=Allosphingosinicella flava TaxID=2771430 RepID=A0A7T2GKT1_9SPHN|nr:CAP domain-containing protein [Sphingosinicella flava]QPQ55685.1 hypothetical protein IC614_03565 [Sphingosinicella flava]
MRTRNTVSFLLALAALLGACSAERPPWADGALVTERIPVGGAPQRLDNLSARILVLHNRERQAAGVAPLAWDRALAMSAAAYGPKLARIGQLRHSPGADRPGQGENLWMGTRDAYSVEEMIGGWINEKRIFRPGLFPDDVSRSGNWSDVAHYTQMIWPATTRIGCAVHKAGQWDYLICRYSPPGNVVGRRVP